MIIDAIYIFFAILAGATLIYLYVRKEPRQQRPAKDVDPARIRDKCRPAREAKHWETPMSQKQLKEVRDYIHAELPKIELTDWSYYALAAITNYSPEFSKLLVGDELDLDLIKSNERTGIDEAIASVKLVDVKGMRTLRQYFHETFMSVYMHTAYAGGDKFYWYGRDRVIALLRSYRASQGRFMPAEVRVCDTDGEQLIFNKGIDQENVKKMKRRFEMLQQRAAATGENTKSGLHYSSRLPFVEFELDRIAEKGIFKYNGSLVNSLYIDIRASLGLCDRCSYDGTWSTTTTTYDMEISYFGFEDGTALVIKHRGAVATAPDCVVVEFHDIPEDSWLVRWLKSYKLHLEGND